MRWKIVKLYEYSIYFIVFLYLGFINLFKDLNSLSISIGVVISVLLYFIYVNQKNREIKVSRYVSIYIGVFILMFGIQLYRLNSFSLSGYTIKDALIHNRYYAYMLLTFPMTEVLAITERRMRFINNIYYMGVAILIFRFSAWFLYNKLHMNVAPGYFEVMGFDWARNGVSRLSGTFLDNYVWVMALFKIIKEKSTVIKIRSISVIVLCFLYAYIVYDSRSQQIAYLLSLVVFILIVSDTFKSKALDVVGAIAISPIIFRGNYLNKLVNTFSTSNADYGSSTQIRMMTLNTYQTLWIERGVWWGYGISNDGNYFNILDTHMVNQSDLGILSMLFQYGIIGFVIFISPFVMGLYVSLKKIKFVQNKFLFLLICTTVLTSIMSQNMYDPFRFLIVPFLLSFISVVSFMNKKEN